MQTFRFASLATRPIVCSRAAFDAKVVTSTRPLAFFTCARRPSCTPSSDPDGLSWKTLVESHTNASTPSSPIMVSVSVLGASPSTGVSSIFQSPVWKTLPNGVSINTPLPSGIECDSATKLTLNGPSSMLPPRSTMLSFTLPVSPSSSSFPAISPAVNGVANRGAFSSSDK